MSTRDTSEIKNKIIYSLRKNGPSLPVHISKEIETNTLFTSAFLSELISEKKIKTSVMKIGSSRLYFLPGQENLLDKFSHHLKSKEKEAYSLLKDRKTLKDSNQEPAIRVALRAIRDFAVPFKKGDDIFWKFFLNKNEDTLIEEKQKVQTIKTPKEKNLNIFDDKKEEKKLPAKKKTVRKKSSSSNENVFFKDVKSFMSKNSIELIDMISFGKKEIVLKVKKDGKEKAIVAYNKKKINDKDLVNAFKKINNLRIPYMILCKDEPYKKTVEIIEAIKKLDSVEKTK